jgi:mono/diheme cytochrome c family protein
MKAIVSSLAIVLLAVTVASGFSRKIQNSSQTTQAGQPAPTGNATRGKTLFDKTLRCYACHGFDGQTGNPRLVPMARTEEAFITYLRKPATPAMPAFADVPRQDLADVYAYIRTLKVDAAAADSIPLLRDLIDRANKTTK